MIVSTHQSAQAEKSKVVSERTASLTKHFSYSLYVNICRSLFEKDKLLFSFAICVAVETKLQHSIAADTYRFFLTGGVSTKEAPANPVPWLSDKLWAEAVRLSELSPEFKGLSGTLQFFGLSGMVKK